MKKLMIGASALVLLTACGGASEDDVAGNIAEAGSAAVRSAEDALSALGNIKLRRGDASEAEAALAAMSLAGSGDGRVAFESRSVDGDTARFEDVTIAIPARTLDETVAGDEDGPQIDFETDFDGGMMKIGVVEFEGLDMTDAGATFSRMSFDGIEFVPRAPVPADDAEPAAQDDTDEPTDPAEPGAGADADERVELEIGRFDLINPSPDLSAWVSSIMGNGTPAPLPSAASLSFDRLSLSALDLRADDPAEGNMADISIASIDLGKAAENRLGIFALQGLAMDIEDGAEDTAFTLSLDSLGLSGVKTGAANSFLEAAGSGDEEAAMAALGQVYANPVDPGFDRFELAGLALNGEGISLALPKVDSLVRRREDGEPVGFVTEPYTLTLSADPEGGEAGGELAGALGMIGFETVEVTGQGKAAYDPDTDRLTLQPGENRMELKDGFALSIGGDIGGYKAYGAAMQAIGLSGLSGGNEPDPAAAQEALSALALHGLEIEIDDNSMVDRVFNLVAAQSGEDPETVRNQAVGMLAMAPMMAGGAGVDMSIVTEATTALTAFLQDPGKLTIKLAPEQPLSAGTFAAMEDPGTLTKETLGFSMQHSN